MTVSSHVPAVLAVLTQLRCVGSYATCKYTDAVCVLHVASELVRRTRHILLHHLPMVQQYVTGTTVPAHINAMTATQLRCVASYATCKYTDAVCVLHVASELVRRTSHILLHHLPMVQQYVTGTTVPAHINAMTATQLRCLPVRTAQPPLVYAVQQHTLSMLACTALCWFRIIRLTAHGQAHDLNQQSLLHTHTQLVSLDTSSVCVCSGSSWYVCSTDVPAAAA